MGDRPQGAIFIGRPARLRRPVRRRRLGAQAGASAGRRDQDAGSSSGLRMPRSSEYGMLISGSPCA